MFSKKLAVFAPLSYLLIGVLAQDKNVTVHDTDPSIVVRIQYLRGFLSLAYNEFLIKYTGQGTGDASICKIDANGQLEGGQAGCYNFPTQCASSAAMSQNLDGKAGATFKFKGVLAASCPSLR